jgi:hypothetical protein
MVSVVKPQVQTFTVMVPYTETRTATRKVARTVQVVIPQTVTRDLGHFEDRCVEQAVAVSCFSTPVAAVSSGCFTSGRRCGLLSRLGHRSRGACCETIAAACGSDCAAGCGAGDCAAGCGPQTVTITQKVWVPNLITVTENVTVNKVECVDEPYTYTVSLCRAETRQQTVNVTSFEPVTKSRVVSFVVSVPKTMTGTQTQITYKTENFQETVNTTVCVPVQVQKQVAVQVCRMVPRTIQVCVKVPIAAGCGGVAAGDCGGLPASGCGSPCN